MTPEEAKQKAQDIVDEACLDIHQYEDGTVSALRDAIASALGDASKVRVEAKSRQTLTDDKELIERLRNLARQQAGNDGEDASYSGGRRLTAEDAVYWIAASRISSLLEEVAMLREALRPFAWAAETYDPEEEGDGPTAAWAHDFTIASLRRARSALSESKP